MRTTDSPWDSKPSNPLGERVIQPTPPTTAPHSKPVGPYGVVTLPDGTMRTTRDNLPKFVTTSDPCLMLPSVIGMWGCF